MRTMSPLSLLLLLLLRAQWPRLRLLGFAAAHAVAPVTVVVFASALALVAQEAGCH